MLWINFSDTYINLAFKTLAIVLFQQRMHANWMLPVFVTDDDMIVFVNNLAKFLQNTDAKQIENSIIGSCWSDAKAIRDPKHKK